MMVGLTLWRDAKYYAFGREAAEDKGRRTR
jgi:hypothetical protein